MTGARNGCARLVAATSSRAISRTRKRGATLVEFALILPVFLVLMLGVVEGSWYVLEVSAISNSARTAARWETVASNYNPADGDPICATSTRSAPLVAAAQSTAGPFASAITSASLTNIPVTNSQGAVIGCTLTLTVPDQPLESLLPLGQSRIASTFTAYLN